MSYKIFKYEHGLLIEIPYLYINWSRDGDGGVDYGERKTKNSFISMESAFNVMNKIIEKSQEEYHYSNLNIEDQYVILPVSQFKLKENA